MKKVQRDLNKLQSSRAARLKADRKRWGNPHRARAMQDVRLDYYRHQDQLAAQRFQLEMDMAKLADEMFDKKIPSELTEEQLAEVIANLDPAKFEGLTMG